MKAKRSRIRCSLVCRAIRCGPTGDISRADKVSIYTGAFQSGAKHVFQRPKYGFRYRMLMVSRLDMGQGLRQPILLLSHGLKIDVFSFDRRFVQDTWVRYNFNVFTPQKSRNDSGSVASSGPADKLVIILCNNRRGGVERTVFT